MLRQRVRMINHAQAVTGVMNCIGLGFSGHPAGCCASPAQLKTALFWPGEGLILVQRSRIWELEQPGACPRQDEGLCLQGWWQRGSPCTYAQLFQPSQSVGFLLLKPLSFPFSKLIYSQTSPPQN